MSALGKSYVEDKLIGAAERGGYLPRSGPRNYKTPEQSEMSRRYELQRQKMTTDPAARQKALFSTNIDKSLDMIDEDALTQYSGVQGEAQLLKDKLASGLGFDSPSYTEYSKSLADAQTAAKQIRQFLGESIRPETERKLELMTNPSTWSKSPELAKQTLQETKKLLRNEMSTYRDALKSVDVFEGKAPTRKEALPKGYSQEDIAYTAKEYGMSA